MSLNSEATYSLHFSVSVALCNATGGIGNLLLHGTECFGKCFKWKQSDCGDDDFHRFDRSNRVNEPGKKV